MTDSFDPYRKWLGIRPQDQPPHHYRLLGLEIFEADEETIANAADQRMAYLKGFQSGRHLALSQKLLNEVAAARVCLLNPEKKALYDARLRENLEPVSPPRVVEETWLPVAPTPPLYVARNRGGVRRGPWGAVFSAAALVFLGAFVAGVWYLTRIDEPLSVSAEAPRAAGQVPAEHREASQALAGAPTDSHVHDSDRNGPVTSPAESLEAEETGAVREGLPGEDPAPEDRPAEEPSTRGDAAGVDDGRGDIPGLESSREPPDGELPPTPAPVPDPAEVEEASREIREQSFAERWREATTPGTRLELAQALERRAAGESSPANRFALRQASLELAVEAGIPIRALEVIDGTAVEFAIDKGRWKTGALARMAAAAEGDRSASQRIVVAALRVADEALAAGEPAAAQQALDVTVPLVRSLRDSRLTREVRLRTEHLVEIESARRRFQASLARLETGADDAAAHWEVGAWLALVAGDWEQGLSHLARGEGEPLAELARRDLAGPEDADEQMALADAWWDLGEEHEDLAQLRLRSRAARWYEEALPETTGPRAVRAERRAAEAGTLFEPGAFVARFDGYRSHAITDFLFDGRSPITIEAIVAADRPQNQAGIAHNNLGNGGLGLTIAARRYAMVFHETFLPRPTADPQFRSHVLRSREVVPVNRWVHLAGVFDGREVRFYLDGQLHQAARISGRHHPSPLPLVLGAAPAGETPEEGFDQHFAGRIQALRISNRPRYDAPFPAPLDLHREVDTVLLLVFDQGRGATVRDASGRRHTFPDPVTGRLQRGYIRAELREIDWVPAR